MRATGFLKTSEGKISSKGPIRTATLPCDAFLFGSYCEGSKGPRTNLVAVNDDWEYYKHMPHTYQALSEASNMGQSIIHEYSFWCYLKKGDTLTLNDPLEMKATLLPLR